MGLTNTRLAMASYALSAGGASGFSLMVLSYAMSSPSDFAWTNGFTLTITNDSTTGTIHVEPRTTWTNINGVSTTTPVTNGFLSNVQTFGGSAAVPQSIILLLSGQDAVLPIGRAAGSALQIWVLAASTVADAAGVSGQVILWGNGS